MVISKMAFGSQPSASMLVSMITPSLGDALPEFVHDVDEKYICLKCKNVLRPPVQQTPCGHRICSLCSHDIFIVEESVPCPGNEEDCVTLTPNSMNLDNATKRELLRLDVYCPNKTQGCNDTIEWGKLSLHLEECVYKTILCHNVGCDKVIAIKDIPAHETECDYLLILCSNCNSMITRKEMREGHQDKCATKPHPCPMQPLGCNFKGTKSKMQEHSLSDISKHDSKVVHALQSLKVNLVDLKDKSKEFDETITDLELKVTGMRTESQSNQHLDELQSNASQLRTEFDDLRRSINSCANTSDLAEMRNTLIGVQETAEGQEARIGSLEQGSSNYGQPADVLAKIQRMESTVGMHDVRINESDLRFRLLETAAFDGRLLWRIPEFTRRKREAADGRTLSLYSQPFYSGYYGYKMCARVYLNGDGLGKGSHLSLFFVVMKGEYDALQQWPFRQKVTLSLLDQSGGRKHITDQFRPDPTSSSFRRPVGDMNIASGSPMFAPLSKVESDGYLKDDTIFICVSIDITDLPQIFP